MTSDLTEYQKQKLRDLSSLINAHISNQKNVTLETLILTTKQAVPYSLAPLYATNYAKTVKPVQEKIYTDWIEATNPTMFENLIFHVVLCIHDLFSEDLKTYEVACEDWINFTDILMSYIDGEHWDTYLSDVDKLRELVECLNPAHLQTFFKINETSFNPFLTGEKQFDEENRVKLDVLHRIFEQASYSFQVPAFVSLWFTTPDELTNITPLEYIADVPQEAKNNLILRLKHPTIQEN